MKFIKITGWLLLSMVLIYLLGPQPKKPVYETRLPMVPDEALALISYVQDREQAAQPIKPGNEARIVWQDDSIKNKTPYALVYLHGFSASHEEGNPIHLWMAKKYGMNLYLTRLADHGRAVPEALLGFSAQQAWEDAQTALAIGKQLGDKVILLSTSTGSTLSLLLAAHYPEIVAQILMSPNIRIKDPTARILNDPWGLQIARQVIGGPYRIIQDTSVLYHKYWDGKYRIESLVQLEELLESGMTKSTFQAVKQPTLLLYYYKDETHQDQVVSVPSMLTMFDQLGTPKNLKTKVALPEGGDHGLGSYLKSKDIEGVKREIMQFMDTQLGLR